MPALRSTSKLTDRIVRAASASPDAADGTFIWDNELRGFGLRVYPSGRKLFVYQYRRPADRSSARYTLGPFPDLSVKAARDLAHEAAAKVRRGVDPKGTAGDDRGSKTLAEVLPLYLTERRGKLADRTLAEYERIWQTTLNPEFGSVRVAALSEEQIARWHSSKASTPAAANRTVDLLSVFCTWAERRGYRPRHSNPCVDVERFPESRRSRSLRAEEYALIGSAMRAAELVGIDAPPSFKQRSRGVSKARAAKSTGKPRGPYRKTAPQLRPAAMDLIPANRVAIAAIRFLILSGWREQEALTLRWDAVNLERGVAVLLKTKTGRSERPLGQPALELLRSQPRLADSPWVFPGTHPDKHLVDIKRLWQSVKHAAHLDEAARLRLHDLRHSFTTVARDELGLGDHVIAQLIGHKVSGMTSRYGEVRDRTLRNAADSISGLITQML